MAVKAAVRTKPRATGFIQFEQPFNETSSLLIQLFPTDFQPSDDRCEYQPRPPPRPPICIPLSAVCRDKPCLCLRPLSSPTSAPLAGAGGGHNIDLPDVGGGRGRGAGRRKPVTSPVEVRRSAGAGMSPRVERLFDIGPPPLDESSGNDTGRCDVIVLPREFGQTSRCA